MIEPNGLWTVQVVEPGPARSEAETSLEFDSLCMFLVGLCGRRVPTTVTFTPQYDAVAPVTKGEPQDA